MHCLFLLSVFDMKCDARVFFIAFSCCLSAPFCHQHAYIPFFLLQFNRFVMFVYDCSNSFVAQLITKSSRLIETSVLQVNHSTLTSNVIRFCFRLFQNSIYGIFRHRTLFLVVCVCSSFQFELRRHIFKCAIQITLRKNLRIPFRDRLK